MAETSEPLPAMYVGVDTDHISVVDFEVDVAVTIELTREGTSQGSWDVFPVTNDQGGTEAHLHLADKGMDILAGDVVTATQGSVVKTHTVTNVTFTGADETIPTVTFELDPAEGGNVVVQGFGEDGSYAQRDYLVEDLTLPYTVDLSSLDDPNTVVEEGTVTPPLAFAWIDQLDEDGNATVAQWGDAGSGFEGPSFSVEAPSSVWSSNQEGLTAGEFVEVYVNPSEDRVTSDHHESVEVVDDGWGPQFWVELGYEFGPGDTVVVDYPDGTTSKDLVVVGLVVEGVDVANDLVWGNGPTSVLVEVDVGDESVGAHRTVEADGSTGYWEVDFAPTTADDPAWTGIEEGMGGSAQVFDEDGDSTHRGICTGDCGDPFTAIGVWADTGVVEGQGWTPDSPVTVALTRDGSTQTWTPTTDEGGYFSVEAGAIAGDEIVVTDGTDASLSKSMVVIDLELQVDTAAGPESAVVMTTSSDEDVYVYAQDGGREAMRIVATPTPPAGTVVDFTDAPAEGTEEYGDLVGTIVWAAANSNDPDGDGTNLVWDSGGGDEPTGPTFSVETPRQVWSSNEFGLAVGDVVEVYVDPPEDRSVVDPDGTATVVEETDGENFWLQWSVELGVDADDTSTVVVDYPSYADGTTSKLLDVVLLEAALDPATAVVTGTTSPDTWVQVDVGNELEWAWRGVMSGSDGSFTVDLGAPLEAGQEGDGVMTTPLPEGTGGSAQVFDEDGDSTHRGFCVGCDNGGDEPPTVFVSAFGFEYVEGVGWDGLDPLTVDVAGSTCDVTLTDVALEEGPGHFFLDVGRLAEEGDLTGQCDLSPSDVITVTGADGTTKTLIVSDIVVTDVDPMADVVSGVGTAGSELMFQVWDEEVPVDIPVLVKPDGTWSVPVGIDLVVDGPSGAVYQWDEDGDATQSDWFVADPVLIANPAQDLVVLPDWPSGEDATLSVYASEAATTLLHQQAVALPGPYFVAGEVWLDDLGGLDLQPGQWVEVSTTSVTRAFTVSPVQVTDVDFATATVSGLIDAGASGFVGVGGDFGECEAEFTDNDADGKWSVTLTVQDGCEDFSMGTHVEGAAGQDMVDEDGSQGITLVFWSADHVTETISDGGTVSSGDGTVDEGDPVETTVTAPAGTNGDITVTETTVTGEVTGDYSLLGSQVAVTSTVTATGEPFELTFLLDASIIPDGEDASTITVFRDGIAVPDCVDVPEGTHPCVAERLTDGQSGDVTITVLTDGFSTWTLGVPVLRFGQVSVPGEPLAAPATFTVSAAYTDLFGIDDDSVTWRLQSAANDVVVQGTAADGVATGTFSDVPVGVYLLEAVLTDEGTGATTTLAHEYVVVYDPDGGFVTGGGWIDSPAGAYTADETLTGRATFGFVAKYHKGADVPDGNTQFQFRAGDLEFRSTSYDWLVVAGRTHAKFKGTGTVNGVDGHQFMLTAVDGEPDTFRIKIWEGATGSVVYDNAVDDSGGTPLGGGSIVVHTTSKYR